MTRTDPLDQAPAQEFPNGHLNHLSTEQANAFEEFKEICRDTGRSDILETMNDDATMLRFLRARNFVPRDAFEQFRATMEWRKEQDIENWYDTIELSEYEATRLLYTQWTGRRDKRGFPLYVFDISGLDPQNLSACERSFAHDERYGKVSPKLRRLFATYEHMMKFVMPLCSVVPSRPHSETPISQSTCIVDISGMGIRQFWNLKTHLQEGSALATAHYPETLGRTFIIGAPSFFPMIWDWIKRWFDPITVSKIFILSKSEVESTLKKYIEIRDIPKRYGGKLDWDFGQMPSLGSEFLSIMSLGGKDSIPIGPLRLHRSQDSSDDPTVEVRARGSESGGQRNLHVGEVSSDLVSRYRDMFDRGLQE